MTHVNPSSLLSPWNEPWPSADEVKRAVALSHAQLAQPLPLRPLHVSVRFPSFQRKPSLSPYYLRPRSLSASLSSV